MPERIQLRRAKGWRKPDGAIVVTRSTSFGNPFHISIGDRNAFLQWKVWPSVDGTPNLFPTKDAATVHAVAMHHAWLRGEHEYPQLFSIDQHTWSRDWVLKMASERLRGADLACWCALGDPCHADTLLDLANRPRT